MTIFADDFKHLCPHGKPSIIDGLAEASGFLAAYDVTTPRRIAHFWAQVAHETDGLKTLSEYWGPTEAQRRYEGRADLGNTHPGDGHKYMGRGAFQLTGRANYARYGQRLGVDLVGNPQLAADPKTSLAIALLYWRDHGCNALADKNDIVGVTKKINGGTNGLAARRAYFAQAWKLWGGEEKPPEPSKTMATSKTGNTAIGGVLAAAAGAKAAIEQANDAKETAQSAGAIFGLSGNSAMILGAAAIVIGCFVFVWWDRHRKLRDEGV